MPMSIETIGVVAGALITAFLVALITTPIVKSLAQKWGAVDVPKDGRRMHDHPIPRMGGLAIFLGFLLSVILFIPFVQTDGLGMQLQGMLLGAVFLKERFTVRQLLFGLMSLAGAVLIAMSGEGGGASLAGILVLICAVITGSGFSLLSRRCADRYTAFERTYVMFGLGMAVFVTAALVTEGGNLAAQAGKALGDIRILGALLYLGIISSVAAFCMLNYSVNDLTVAQATSYTNLATVVSMVAGAIFLAEPVGPAHLAGCALILVGVYCSNREGIRVSLHQKQSVK